MSGFAGFCTFPDPPPDPTGLLARLQRASPLPSVFVGEHAGLAASRLARSADGRCVIAFDGAIYNRDALRTEMESAGLPVPPPGADHDPALILALYAQHGSACVERLRGPFAFALWDGRGDNDGAGLLLARDSWGLRALYYFHDEPGGRFFFASGVRPLAASGVVPRQLDARGLYGFFRHGAVPEPFSMVAGVHALETAGRLEWRAGRVTRDRFRAAPTGDQSLRAALLDRVSQQLADGQPAGVFVGGGVGSALLLALAREAGREKSLRALTIGFDGGSPDESDLARRTAEHFGVPHTLLRLDRARARVWFEDFLPGLDQPGVWGFPLFALCRFAREEGIETALTGLGLREFFGDAVLHGQVRRLMRWGERRGSLRQRAERALLGAATCPSRARLDDFLGRSPTLAGAYAAVRGVHTAGEARAMVARFTDPTGCADPAPGDVSSGDPLGVDDEISGLEWRRGLRDRLLRDADTFSRANGVELRLPFVDERVAQAVAQIPANVRAWTYPVALGGAVREIPPWILRNTSPRGLCFPLEQWGAGEWGASKPTDAAGVRTRRAWEQKWSLFLFRRWWRQVDPG